MSGRSWFAIAAALGAAACIATSTDPDEIVGIEFAEFPWPSVVAGDTLRDASGTVMPLSARLFAGDGSEVLGGPVEFLTEVGAVRVVLGDLLVADDTAEGTARLRASTAGVQSVPRQLEVIPSPPDSMAPDGTLSPLLWVVPDDAQTNTSGAIGAAVLATAGDGSTSGVRSWIVRFQLEANGEIVAPGDTSGVFLVGDGGRPSYVDTTSTQGQVSRRVRVRISPGFTPPDSVVVLIWTTYRGVLLAGAPVRRVLPLGPR